MISFILFALLGITTKVLLVLHNCFTAELYPQPSFYLLF